MHLYKFLLRTMLICISVSVSTASLATDPFQGLTEADRAEQAKLVFALSGNAGSALQLCGAFGSLGKNYFNLYPHVGDSSAQMVEKNGGSKNPLIQLLGVDIATKWADQVIRYRQQQNPFIENADEFSNRTQLECLRKFTNGEKFAGFSFGEYVKSQRDLNVAALESKFGETDLPIHIQTMAGEYDTIKEIIASGVDVDALNTKGYTALMLAALNQQGYIAEILLEAGADPDLKNPNGFSALYMSLGDDHWQSNYRVAKALIPVSDINNAVPNGSETALMAAAKSKTPWLIQRLITGGADVNAVQKDGYSVLQKSALEGDGGVVVTLLDAGADLNYKSPDGKTAIKLAKKYNPEVYYSIKRWKKDNR